MFHILVINSSAARLFEATRSDAPLVEVYDFINPPGHMHDRDLVSARPGRMLNRAAGIHQSLGQRTSTRVHAIARWTHSLGKPIHDLLVARDSRGLVIVGSPRLIAAARAALPKSVSILATVPRISPRNRRGETRGDAFHDPAIGDWQSPVPPADISKATCGRWQVPVSIVIESCPLKATSSCPVSLAEIPCPEQGKTAFEVMASPQATSSRRSRR